MTTTQSLSESELLQIRLATQGLTDPRFRTPEEAVQWLGAVQSQEFAVARWSLGQRSVDLHETGVASAFDAGLILRTHVLRPTWHFVAQQDILWILTATAHRVHQLNAFMYRQCELDEELLHATSKILESALSDGNHRTRDEMRAALSSGGVIAEGTRLGCILMYAELESLICSGAVRGKQQTYALIDQRAPDAVRLDAEESLAELVKRYFTSHGPATIKDCAGWASLTLADVRRGIAMVGDGLESVEVDGLAYWFGSTLPAVSPVTEPHALLVQGYDEYVMGYFETRHQMVGRDLFERSAQNPFLHIVLVNSLLAGRWKRTVKRAEVQVEIRPDRELTGAEWSAIDDAARSFASFYELSATIVRR